MNAVAAGSGVHVMTQILMDGTETNTDIPLNIEAVEVERCWAENGDVNIMLRNTGTDSVNIEKAKILVDGQPVESEVEKEIIDPEKTAEMSFTTTKNAAKLQLAQSTNTKPQQICQGIELIEIVKGFDIKNVEAEDVEEGQTFTLDFTIQNNAETQQTQTIKAEAPVKNPQIQINQEKTLQPGEQTSLSQDWNTEDGDNGTYQYNITTEDYQAKSNFKITDQDTTQPVSGAIHEGGDNTSTLEWGTEGSASILPTEAFEDDGGFGSGEICFGDQCTYDTGNEPPEKPADGDDYVTERVDQMTGSLKTSTIETNASEKFCIGNECEDSFGGDTEVYGETENPAMDGPLFVDEIVADGSLCLGANC